MAETDDAKDTTTEDAPTQEEGKAQETAPEEHDAEYWKARARQWESNAKKNAAAAKEWREWQEAHKTDEQKAADEKAALEADRDSARRDARLAKAALKHGLSEEDLALIDPSGDDDVFEARVAAFAERLASASKSQPNRFRDPNLGREHVNTPAGDWLRQSLSGS